MNWAVVLALAVPGAGAAQSFEWSAAPGVFFESDRSGGSELGPAVVFGVAVRADRQLAFAFDLTLARTDFESGPDELHRNIASASAALRLMMGGERSAFGVTLGVGVVAWDDVSETDAAFRSGANAKQIFVPGLLARFAIGESWGVTAFGQDQMTGLIDRVFDPSEGHVDHRYALGVGVYFR